MFLAISLDIETYGGFLKDAAGKPLPTQSVFNPQRSIQTDKVAPHDLIQTVSITPILFTEPPTWISLLHNQHSSPNKKHSSQPPNPISPWSTEEGAPTGIPTAIAAKPSLLPRYSGDSFDGQLTTSKVRSALSTMTPLPTMVFQMSNPQDRLALMAWLTQAQLILGTNIQFDILYLRTQPDLRNCLHHQILIDLLVLNFLSNEVRDARSLKALGKISGEYDYDTENTLADNHRFPSPFDEGAIAYNASDTHNTILGVAWLVREIASQYPTGDQLSPASLIFYSRLIWSCVRMAEAGLPFDVERLYALYTRLEFRSWQLRSICEAKWELVLSGKGSDTSKAKLLTDALALIPNDEPSLRLLTFTEKKKKLSLNDENRTLIESLLPPKHPYRHAFSLWGRHVRYQKLVSSYCYPLLFHKRTDPTKTHSILLEPPPCHLHPHLSPMRLPDNGTSSNSSTLLPKLPLFANSTPNLNLPTDGVNMDPPVSSTGFPSLLASPLTTRMCLTPMGFHPSCMIGYPTWYVTPAPVKDGQGSEGGTQQSRIVCKDPAAQTFPPAIKSTMASRFNGGVLFSIDLSQIELRVAALLSGDEGMVQEYLKSKPDLHGQRAISIFGPQAKESPHWKSGDVKNDPRQWGKTMNFADLFLASALRMQKTILEMSGELHPLAFFEEIENTRHLTRPGLWAWQQSLLQQAGRDGIITLPFIGQSRHFPGDPIRDHKNEIVNFPVQSMASNAMLEIQGEIHTQLGFFMEKAPPVVMYQNTYDALYFDGRRALVEPTLAIIKSAIDTVHYRGFWAALCHHLGRYVPLVYDITIKDH